MKWINVVARNLFRKLPRSFLKKHIQRQEPSETSKKTEIYTLVPQRIE